MKEDHRIFDTVFRSCKRKPGKIQACMGFEPLTSWVPETVLSAVSVRFVASAYRRRCVGLRPTPKIPAACEKNLWYQGTAVQWLQRWHVGKTNMLQNVGRTTFCAYLFAFSLASLSLSGCLRMVSFRGQIKFESHPDWCPLGIHFNFLMSISTLLTKIAPLSSPLVTYTSPKR